MMTFDDFHCDEPDWSPLESILPPEECAAFVYSAFMYMGWLELGSQRLHHYKHVITRRYLFVTDELETFRYESRRDRYVRMSRRDAIAYVLEEPC